MVRIPNASDAVRATIRFISVLERSVADRDATADAQRAQAARLYWTQAGLPAGACSRESSCEHKQPTSGDPAK